MAFSCSICEQESTRICVECTKDACSNHLCERCGCCSDCCDCELPLDEPEMTHLHVPTAIVVEPTSVEENILPDDTPTGEQAPAASADLTGLHSVPRQEPGDESEEPFPASENNSGF